MPKCIRTLPSLRVTECLELALMRLAAADDRSLSDYVRLVLERHVFGHAAHGDDDGGDCLHRNASQCDARNT